MAGQSSVLGCLHPPAPPPPLTLNPFIPHHNVPLSSSSSSSSSSQNLHILAKGSMESTLEEETQTAKVERLWQQFFSDPSQWWDKRSDKANPEAPDFKHKTSKKALWINYRFSPPWLQAKLSTLPQQAPHPPPPTSSPSSSSSSSSSPSTSLSHSSSTCLISSSDASRTEQLWEEFFLDPSNWWDNRSDKVNYQMLYGFQ